MGDGVLAYFGWPRAHEDDAERAVRAGLAITEAVGHLNSHGGKPLAARVGIATGLVMVGELIGAGAAKEQTVVGDTPNLAARLQALAAPGSVMISQATRRLVGDRLAPVKEAAQIGAAIGREFSDELLAAVASMDHDRLQGSLDQLVASELVFRRGAPAAATYVFKHALVQDAAYQSLLKSRRQQLHARIAAVLEMRVEDAQREPELLAHHYRQAGLLESAIPYAAQAGDVAFGRFAFVEARARYQEAMDMAEALPPSEQASRLRIRAMLKLALIFQLLGEFGHMPPREAYPKARAQ